MQSRPLVCFVLFFILFIVYVQSVPPNDRCTNPEVIYWIENENRLYSEYKNNFEATSEASAFFCGRPLYHSVWCKVNSGNMGYYYLNVCNSTTASIKAMFFALPIGPYDCTTRVPCEYSNQIQCNQQGLLLKNREYLIVVGSDEGDTGEFQFNLTLAFNPTRSNNYQCSTASPLQSDTIVWGSSQFSDVAIDSPYYPENQVWYSYFADNPNQYLIVTMCLAGYQLGADSLAYVSLYYSLASSCEFYLEVYLDNSPNYGCDEDAGFIYAGPSGQYYIRITNVGNFAFYFKAVDASAPANDECALSQAITQSDYGTFITGSFLFATYTAGIADYTFPFDYPTVWYSIRDPNPGQIIVYTCDLNPNIESIAISLLKDCSSLTARDNTTCGRIVYDIPIPDTNFDINIGFQAIVDPLTSKDLTFTFYFNYVMYSTGDCSAPISIGSSASQSIIGDNLVLANTGPIPDCLQIPVFYRYSIFYSFNSDSFTYLHLYFIQRQTEDQKLLFSDYCSSEAYCFAPNTELGVIVATTQNYIIGVTSSTANGRGTFTFQIEPSIPTRPPNDLCPDAELIGINMFENSTISGNLDYATDNMGNGYGEVFYQFSVGSNTDINFMKIYVCTDYYLKLEILVGNCNVGLTSEATSINENFCKVLYYSVVVPADFYLAVSGGVPLGSFPGRIYPFELTVEVYKMQPVVNSCDSPEVITITEGVITGTNLFVDPGQPIYFCGFSSPSSSNMYWYSFYSEENNFVTIRSCELSQVQSNLEISLYKTFENAVCEAGSVNCERTVLNTCEGGAHLVSPLESFTKYQVAVSEEPLGNFAFQFTLSQQQVFGDNCYSAIVLSTTRVVNGSLDYAQFEIDEYELSDCVMPFQAIQFRGVNTWYRFNTAANNFLIASMCHNGGFSDIPTSLLLYKQDDVFDCSISYQCIAGDRSSCGNGAEIYTTLFSHTVYYLIVQLDTLNPIDSGGDFAFYFELSNIAAADTCSEATRISIEANQFGHYIVEDSLAFGSSDEIVSCGNIHLEGVRMWYVINSQNNNQLELEIDTTLYNFVFPYVQMAIFGGDCENLFCSSVVTTNGTFSVLKNTDYYFIVVSYGINSVADYYSQFDYTGPTQLSYYNYFYSLGKFSFRISLSTVPTANNDKCADASIYTFPDQIFDHTTFGAQLDDADVLDCYTGEESGNVWYQIDVDNTYNYYRISACGQSVNFELKIALFIGTSCSTLQCIRTSTSSSYCGPPGISEYLEPGRYYFYVSGANPVAFGNFGLDLAAFNQIQPANDVCDGSMPTITEFPFLLTGSIAFSTADIGESIYCGLEIVGDCGNLWFAFYSEDFNNIILSLVGRGALADFDSMLFLYQGDRCTELSCVAQNDNFEVSMQSYINSVIINQRKYYFAIAKKGDTSEPTGDFSMNIERGLTTAVQADTYVVNGDQTLFFYYGTVLLSLPDILPCTTDFLTNAFVKYFLYIPTQFNFLTATILDSDVDTILDLFTLDSEGNTTCVIRSTNAIATLIDSDLRYALAVAVPDSALPLDTNGNFALKIEYSVAKPPTNDMCSLAKTLLFNTITNSMLIEGSTILSSNSYYTEDIPSCLPYSAINGLGDIWYSFNSFTYTTIFISSCRPLASGAYKSFSIAFALYKGDSCDDLTCVGLLYDSNFDNCLDFNSLIDPGNNYYLSVSNTNGSPPNTGIFALYIELYSPIRPGNDNCLSATQIAAIPVGGMASNAAFSTNDIQCVIPYYEYYGPAGNIWFDFNSSQYNGVLFDICPYVSENGFSAGLIILTGSCESYECVISDFNNCQDGASIATALIPSTQYFLAVASYDYYNTFFDYYYAQPASVTFSYQFLYIDPPSNDLCDSATEILEFPFFFSGSLFAATVDKN